MGHTYGSYCVTWVETPLSADSSIASPSCQALTGVVGGYLHGSREWQAHGVPHASGHGEVHLRPACLVQIRRCRSPSAAKPHLITDDCPPTASACRRHIVPKHPLVGINAPTVSQKGLPHRRHV